MYQFVANIYVSEGAFPNANGQSLAVSVVRNWASATSGTRKLKVVEVEQSPFEWIPFDGNWSAIPESDGAFRIELPRGPSVMFQYFPRRPTGLQFSISVDPAEMGDAIEDRQAFVDLLEFCTPFVPRQGLCWIDHEHVVQVLEEQIGFDRLPGLAWANVVGAEVVLADMHLIPKMTQAEMMVGMNCDGQNQPKSITILTRTDLHDAPGAKEAALSVNCDGLSIRGIACPKVGSFS